MTSEATADSLLAFDLPECVRLADALALVPVDVLPSVLLWATAADSWTFCRWTGVANGIRRCAAGENSGMTTESAGTWLARSITGRLFCPAWQICWRRLPTSDGCIHRIVLMGHLTDALQPFVHFSEPWNPARTTTTVLGLSQAADTPSRFLLWGEQSQQTPGEWVELTIPQRFEYPLSDDIAATSPRLSLEGRQWLDGNGQLHFVRYTQLSPGN